MNLKKALKLLEEMRPHCCCIRIQSDYDYVWDVWYIPQRDIEDKNHEFRKHKDEIPYVKLSDAIVAAYNDWKVEKESYDKRSTDLVKDS